MTKSACGDFQDQLLVTQDGPQHIVWGGPPATGTIGGPLPSRVWGGPPAVNPPSSITPINPEVFSVVADVRKPVGVTITPAQLTALNELNNEDPGFHALIAITAPGGGVVYVQKKLPDVVGDKIFMLVTAEQLRRDDK